MQVQHIYYFYDDDKKLLMLYSTSDVQAQTNVIVGCMAIGLGWLGPLSFLREEKAIVLAHTTANDDACSLPSPLPPSSSHRLYQTIPPAA